MATPSKRKQQSISIETKRKIIDESEAGKSYGKLAREYELPRSTVQTIVENKAKILEAIDSGIGPKRARLTTAKNPELEASVLAWFTQVRGEKVVVTGPLLKVIFLYLSLPTII